MFRGILGRIGALLALTLATQVQAGGNAAPESTPASVPHSPKKGRIVGERIAPTGAAQRVCSVMRDDFIA